MTEKEQEKSQPQTPSQAEGEREPVQATPEPPRQTPSQAEGERDDSGPREA